MNDSKDKKEGFHQSPTMVIHFPGGKVIPMNRATRRKNKIFSRNLKKISPMMTPPNIRKL